MLKIGVTGGIGSGKTKICQIFEILGIPVFYADVVAKEMMSTDAMLKQKICETFGASSYTRDGHLNRKYLANCVFSNPSELARLNAIVHPAVFQAFDLWVAKQQAPYLIKEAALLLESQSYKMCHYLILVQAPLDLKIQRIIARDQISVEEIRKRIHQQWTDEQKQKMADFILMNDEKQLLLPQIIDLHEQFLKLAEINR